MERVVVGPRDREDLLMYLMLAIGYESATVKLTGLVKS